MTRSGAGTMILRSAIAAVFAGLLSFGGVAAAKWHRQHAFLCTPLYADNHRWIWDNHALANDEPNAAADVNCAIQDSD